MAQKYVDLTGLDRFLVDLKTKLKTNSVSSFPVAYAGKAVNDGNDHEITATYVPKTLTIAGVDLQDNITKSEVLQALGTDGTAAGAMEAGAQVNKLEGISFKGSGESSYSDLTIDGNKKAQLDLSSYALKSELAAALNFRGTATGAELKAKTASTVNNGDVWSCSADDLTGDFKFHAGYEYAATLSGTPASLTWVELGKYLDLSGFVLKTQTVNGKALSGNIVLAGSDIALTGYTKASADAAVAAADTINAAVGKLEYKVDANKSAISTLNGDDTTTGSVAKSIKDAIAGLDVTAVSGDYITSVGEVDGKVTVVAGTKGSVTNGSSGLVDGGAVYTAVEGAKSASAVTLTGSSATASDPTGEGTFTFKQGSGTAQTIDVKAQINRIETVKVKGIGAPTADTMTIDSKAVTVDLNDYFGSVTDAEIDGIFGITG